MRLAFVLAGALALLGACAQTPAPVVNPPIGFTGRAAIKIDAPRVEIVEAYAAPLRAPNVEHEFAQRPSDLVKAWLRDRLRPAGQGGQFVATIKDASIIAEPLAVKGGIEGAFTKQQSVNLVAKVVVLLEYRRAGGFEATATVSVARSRTLPEGLSLADRDRAYYEFSRELAADLDAQLEANVNDNLRDALL